MEPLPDVVVMEGSATQLQHEHYQQTTGLEPRLPILLLRLKMEL